MKKRFKLILYDQDQTLCVLFSLIFLLAKIVLVPKKRHIKMNLVKIFGSSNSKKILTLLIEIVAFHMRVSIEKAFKSMSWDFSEILEVQVSETVSIICCKSFFVYLGPRNIVAKTIAIRRFASRGLTN